MTNVWRVSHFTVLIDNLKMAAGAGRWRKLLKYGSLAGVGLAGAGSFVYLSILVNHDKRKELQRSLLASKGFNKRPSAPLPSRREQLQSLGNVASCPARSPLIMSLPAATEEFDVLIIGGGATGAGCAVDATSRGLKTALVELDDFASGTSSRSTKLIHGGVRYLQKAIMGLDLEQYNMVREALHERANLLEIAPHLSFPLPIMLPIYKWWQLPYYWAGIKAYDLVSGGDILRPSYVLSKSSALELFPMLKPKKLKGAIVYYDGMHNDARMCLSIAITAARLGASVAK